MEGEEGGEKIVAAQLCSGRACVNLQYGCRSNDALKGCVSLCVRK